MEILASYVEIVRGLSNEKGESAMHDHTVVERSDHGTATGMLLGIVLVVLIAAIALFFVFGGPGRFVGPATPPNNTNVNVPQQQQPPQGQSGPNINIPRQIDINVNQPGQQSQPAPAGEGR